MTARTPALVSTVLAEYGDITRRAVGAYLPAREPRRYLYDVLADYPRRGGRMMRPSLCIATARAFGARLDDALHAAVAIELIHNAMLIHDDIEDESEERRGRPTLHAMHGVPIALNAGDALTLLGLRALLDGRLTLGPRLTMRVLEETERMARESAEGQALELGWRRDNVTDLEERDYLDMVLKKTCWLATILPGRMGALIATRDGIDLDPFIRFGFFLGAAFQIQDDLLNLVGDHTRYGKELGGDLREGKRTLMLIHLLRHAAPDERARIAAILGGPRAARHDDDVAWMRARMDALGSIDYARQLAHGLAGAALHECERIYGGLPDTRDRRFIEGLATWVFERT